MPNKNKLPFWQLCIVFGGITLLALGLSYGYGQEQNTGMMSGSMGSMMGSMHLSNLTISDLLTQQEQTQTQSGQNQEHSSHHEETESQLAVTHKLTTGTIVILLPFIVAGTVFLTIIWFGTVEKGGIKK